MELKSTCKALPILTLFMYAALLSMQQSSQSTSSQIVPMLTILTSDGQEVTVPKDIAIQSPVIKDLLGDMADVISYQVKVGTIVTLPLETDITLPAVTKEALDAIVQILKEINAPNKMLLKRADGKYIAQRIQPMIDTALGSMDEVQLGGIIRAAEYLNLEYIANGAIRVLTFKVFEKNRDATIDQVMAYLYSTRGKIKKEQYRPEGLIASLRPFFEMQYSLRKKGGTMRPIKELSIADYIAIHGMPTIDSGYLQLSRKFITSIEGINLIAASTHQPIKRLILSFNYLDQLPDNAFNKLTALEVLDLQYNNIDTLPSTIFSKLTNLKELHLAGNRITQLPVTLFADNRQLKTLSLDENFLKKLPAGLFNNLRQLETLSLNNNPFDYTSQPRDLPFPLDIFAPLTNLKELYILDNEIFKQNKTPRYLFSHWFNVPDNILK